MKSGSRKGFADTVTIYSALAKRREHNCGAATIRPAAPGVAIVYSRRFCTLSWLTGGASRFSSSPTEPSARAEAWKPPRRDIALHRLKRAERLGLDYKSYAGELMNRSTPLGAAIFLLDGLTADEMNAASERIVAISDCRVLIGVPDTSDVDGALNQRVDAVVATNDERAVIRATDRFLFAAPDHAARHVSRENLIRPSELCTRSHSSGGRGTISGDK